MAQFAPDGAVVGEGARVHEGARGADLAAIECGVASLFCLGIDSGIVRGVFVPGLCHGGLDPGGAACLGRSAIVLCFLWVSTPLSRARWTCEHTGHRHSVRNGANRVRWIGSRNALAFCGGCGGGSGGPKVPIERGTAHRRRQRTKKFTNSNALVTSMTTPSPAVLSAETIRRALGEFQLNVGEQQIVYIQQYMKLLLAWNEKINLTAIRDPLEILHRHFCESMYAAVAVPVENGRLADVGSGAGFPGIPLKIMRPALQTVLIESNMKKATFLAEVLRNIELSDTRVLVSRYEELGEEIMPLDFVCSRAVGEFEPFLAWAASERVAAKQVILWIGGRDLDQARSGGVHWEWREPIPVPHSLRRYLLVGTRKI
jgi:16S rRNA (guanine527-N7)-methyltransferase